MKKISIIACGLILVLILASCGSKDNTSKTTASNTPSADAQTTAAAETNETAAPESQGQEGESGEAIETEPAAEVDGDLILDEEGVRIYSQGIAEDSFWGYVVNLTIVNNSGQEISVSPHNTSINGIMVTPSMSEDVEDGGVVETAIEFLDDFDVLGIEEVKEVEFAIEVRDGDWKPIFTSDQITVENPDAASYTQEIDDSGDAFIVTEDIKIVIQELDTDGFLGPQVYTYIENNSGKNISVTVKNASVNGTEIKPTFYTDVLDGKVAITTMSFDQDDLDANNIESIEEVEVSFHIEEMENMDDIVDATDPITAIF